MKRAPLAVVVTMLAASSSSGRPYSRKNERTGLLFFKARGVNGRRSDRCVSHESAGKPARRKVREVGRPRCACSR